MLTKSLHNNQAERVRLYGIDCPEMSLCQKVLLLTVYSCGELTRAGGCTHHSAPIPLSSTAHSGCPLATCDMRAVPGVLLATCSYGARPNLAMHLCHRSAGASNLAPSAIHRDDDNPFQTFKLHIKFLRITSVNFCISATDLFIQIHLPALSSP